MKTLIFTFFLACTPLAAGTDATLPPSPAQRRIESAETVLQKQPDRFQAENDLALALISRARESGDPSYYRQAKSAVARSLQIQPDNFEGEQTHTALMLAEHRYAQALAEAKALNQRSPDAVLVWGYMAEAEEALGDYEEADRAAQWMVNLRPGNVPGLLRAAALREDWGDIEGSADLLNNALEETPAFETEQTAWILTSLARLNRVSGKLEAADSLLQRALTCFPDYYASLEELSRVRRAQHRDADAVDLVQERNRQFPSAQSLYLLATALEQAGKIPDAQTAFSSFEKTAREQIDQPDNANRELILYYAGQGHQRAEALRIARLEIDRRHDVAALDAYAWALYSSGEYAEARRQMDKALAVGNRDADLLGHAAVINSALGGKNTADRQLNGVNPDVAAAQHDSIANRRANSLDQQ